LAERSKIVKKTELTKFFKIFRDQNPPNPRPRGKIPNSPPGCGFEAWRMCTREVKFKFLRRGAGSARREHAPAGQKIKKKSFFSQKN